jgi:hypothetical protein
MVNWKATLRLILASTWSQCADIVSYGIVVADKGCICFQPTPRKHLGFGTARAL